MVKLQMKLLLDFEEEVKKQKQIEKNYQTEALKSLKEVILEIILMENLEI